jgi:hypothetical protein
VRIGEYDFYLAHIELTHLSEEIGDYFRY